jgi:hypothetical protein
MKRQSGSPRRVLIYLSERKSAAEPSGSLASTLPSKYCQFPISEIIEPGPFVDRSAALTAMKGAGVSPRLFFLRRRVNSRAMRAGEMDDQLIIVVHPPMMP